MKKVLTFLFMIILLSSLASAQWGWRYGYFTPEDLLNNEWVVFGLIFAVFFAIVFFALSKTLKENLAAAAIIAAALSLFIAFVFARKVSFYGYVGEELGGWITLIAILIIIAFLIKILTSLIGGIGFFAALYGIWLIAKNTDPYEVFPYELLNSTILSVWEFLESSLFFIIITSLLILSIVAASKNSDIRRWLLGKKEAEPYWPWKK